MGYGRVGSEERGQENVVIKLQSQTLLKRGYEFEKGTWEALEKGKKKKMM